MSDPINIQFPIQFFQPLSCQGELFMSLRHGDHKVNEVQKNMSELKASCVTACHGVCSAMSSDCCAPISSLIYSVNSVLLNNFRQRWEFAKMKKMPPVEGIDSIEDFVHIPLVMENMMFGGNIWDYYRETWACRQHPNVMIVVYEDMVKDLRGLLPKIADFMGLAPREPEVLDKVAAVCTKSFMMEHIEKFDETWTVQKLQEKGLAAVKASRVNETGSKDRFSPATVNLLQRLWEEKMTPFTGHKTYEDFVMGLKE
ncbi:unnamed protein product [Discosporangium mesarthrocarpum]